MADAYTSLVALVLDAPVDDVGAVVQAAVVGGDADRAAPVGDPAEAQEVHWGGRMQRAVVRRVEDDDGAALLRVEAYVGGEGIRQGMRRQAQLVQGLARVLADRVTMVRDLSARTERDHAWLDRVAAGLAEQPDAIVAHVDGEGTHWVHTHGAARFDVPDLELYGLTRSQVAPAVELLASVHDQLIRGGLRADLRLPDATAAYLVPVLEAWTKLPLDWPGIGRAGTPRGSGLDGPRATVSVLHPPRFGRYRRDFAGVLDRFAQA